MITNLLWPINAVHCWMYVSFFLSLGYTSYWLTQFADNRCGEDHVFSKPATCGMQGVGIFVFAMMAFDSALMIRNYDDATQSVLRHQRKTFQELTLRIASLLTEMLELLLGSNALWSESLRNDFSNGLQAADELLAELWAAHPHGAAVPCDAVEEYQRLAEVLEQIFRKPSELYRAKWQDEGGVVIARPLLHVHRGPDERTAAAVTDVWRDLLDKIQEVQTNATSWDRKLLDLGVHLHVPAESLPAHCLVRHEGSQPTWVYQAPGRPAEQQERRPAAAGPVVGPLVGPLAGPVVVLPAPRQQAMLAQPVASCALQDGDVIEAIYHRLSREDGNFRLLWSAMDGDQEEGPVAALRGLTRSTRLLVFTRCEMTSSSADFGGFGTCSCPERRCRGMFFPRDLACPYRMCAPADCLARQPCNPEFPRTCTCPCWSLTVASPLHERLLLTLVLAALYAGLYGYTVWDLLRSGCPASFGGTCALLIIRKTVGFLCFIVFIIAAGHCICNIDRLDLNAAVHSNTQEARKLKEAEEEMNRRCADIRAIQAVLTRLQFFSQNTFNVVREAKCLCDTVRRECRGSPAFPAFTPGLATSLRRVLEVLIKAMGGAREAFEEGGLQRLQDTFSKTGVLLEYLKDIRQAGKLQALDAACVRMALQLEAAPAPAMAGGLPEDVALAVRIDR